MKTGGTGWGFGAKRKSTSQLIEIIRAHQRFPMRWPQKGEVGGSNRGLSISNQGFEYQNSPSCMHISKERDPLLSLRRKVVKIPIRGMLHTNVVFSFGNAKISN